MMEKGRSEPGIPLYLELIGAVRLQQPILGLPGSGQTYDDLRAEAILDEP